MTRYFLFILFLNIETVKKINLMTLRIKNKTEKIYPKILSVASIKVKVGKSAPPIIPILLSFIVIKLKS